MRRPTTLIATLAALLALAAPAHATSATERIIRDCATSPTGLLTGTYTRAQLQAAYNNLPGDVQEYSNCSDAIHQALLNAGQQRGGQGGGGPLGGGGGGGFGGGGTGGGTAGGADAVPQHTGSRAPVPLPGGTVQPGTIPTIGSGAHELPSVLIVLLALIAGAALASAGTTLGRHVLARRRA